MYGFWKICENDYICRPHACPDPKRLLRSNWMLRRSRLVLWAPVLFTLAGSVTLTAESPHRISLADRASAWGLDGPITYGNSEKNIYILETTGTGVAVFDADSDGDNDVFLVNGTTLEAGDSDRAPLAKLFLNQGGRFKDVAASAGLTKRGWGQGACVGDFDNDGHADLAVGYFSGPVLYHNLGRGKFRDVTRSAGLAANDRWAAGCAFLDYDRDGRLDLFFSSYVDLDLARTPKPGESSECNWKGIDVMCGPRGLPRARNTLYRNLGDGRFEDVSEAAGILKPGGRYGLGVVAADFTNDGLTDIYVACDMTPSLLYVNQGDGTFEEVGSISGTAFNVDGQLQAGMGVSVADYDGNGRLDIVKTNFSGDLPSLYNNEDGVFFEDVSAAAGLGKNQLLGWGVLFHDFDADGRPDVLMAHGHVYPEVDGAAIGESYRQPTILYRNLGDGRFQDVSAEAGPALQVNRPARGMALGDLTGDGRPEVVITAVNDRPSVLENAAEPGAFLRIELEGVESNRSAIGARIEIEAGGRTQMQQVVGGGSYYSQSEFALYFGLGSLKSVEQITVAWPNSEPQAFTEIAAGSYRLREGGKLQQAD